MKKVFLTTLTWAILFSFVAGLDSIAQTKKEEDPAQKCLNNIFAPLQTLGDAVSKKNNKGVNELANQIKDGADCLIGLFPVPTPRPK